MIAIKKAELSQELIEEVIKEESPNSLYFTHIGNTRTSKLKIYLIKHKKGISMATWLREIIDALPE